MKDNLEKPESDFSNHSKGKPQPPVKKPGTKAASTPTAKKPRRFKAWIIRLINRAIKKYSKFN